MMTIETMSPASADEDIDVLRQIARGWEYAYGHEWVSAPSLWTECTCAPGHDSPWGCDMTCTVCAVVDALVPA